MKTNLGVFGLPYHGMVIGDSLLTSNNKSILFTGISKGDTQMLQVPKFPPINRYPAEKLLDQAHGFEWRNYALVADNRLGHVNLNDPLYQWIIYIDDNQVPWHLRFGLSLPNFQTAQMWCNIFRPFGRIAKEHPISQLPSLVSQQSTMNGAFLHKNRFTLERNSRGSEIFIHLYASASSSSGINDVIAFPKEGEFQSPWGLYEVWKLKIQGNGLMTEDVTRLGEGISATIEKYLSFSDLQQSISNNIPKQEITLRVNHISLESQRTNDPPVPPNCEGISVTTSDNWSHGLTEPEVLSQGGYFFNNENIVHKTYDWNGVETVNTNIVRILFDKDDQEYRVAIRKTTQSLNKKDVSLSGNGYQNILDATFKLDGGVCKQQPSPYERGLNLTTNIIQKTKVAEMGEILVNQQIVKKLQVEEIRTHTQTQLRTISESGTYDPSSFMPFQADQYDDKTNTELNSKIVITQDNNEVRNFEGQSSDLPPSPFTGSLTGDDPKGVYKTLGIGFVTNNVMGLATTSYLSKGSLANPTDYHVQGLSMPLVKDAEIRPDQTQRIYGSFNPRTLEQVLMTEPCGWV